MYANSDFSRQRPGGKLRTVTTGVNGPWVCIGDFNDISFHKLIQDLELMDCGFKDPAFILYNKREKNKLIEERREE